MRAAEELGFRAVEVAAVAGDLAPSNLSATGRRHLRRLVDNHGLDLVALVADMPGVRLGDTQRLDEHVARTCQTIDLAVDLDVSVVSAAVGALAHPAGGEARSDVIEALRQIGERADARGIRFALRPSTESGDRIVQLLDVLGCPSLRVGLDPASMVMAGTNPVADFQRVAKYLSLVHLRDGTAGSADRSGHETRLGDGEVDVPGILSVLEAAEFDGPHVLRRTASQTPVPDLQHGREMIARILG
jgi:sugar phosphate isomerase/epimerase